VATKSPAGVVWRRKPGHCERIHRLDAVAIGALCIWPTNLRVPLVVPSGDANSDSNIRFYNPTAQAGTVSVIFNDGETGATLGTWNSPSIGAFTAPQFAVKDMEAAGGFSPTNHTATRFRCRRRFPGYFQHVCGIRTAISLTNVTAAAMACRTTSCTS